MEFFAALLEYRFLQYALAACLLASIGCGTIGVYVVVKRIGFLAGGIAHTVLAGMGIAYFLQRSPLAGAAISAVIAAVCIGWIKLRLQQDEDILIAAFWSVGMAIGILFISGTPGYAIDLTSYLFGNILLVSRNDLIFMGVLDALVLAAIAILYRRFLAIAFDEEFARLRGVNVEVFYVFLLCVVALTVVLLIQIVGLILVLALLVLPAAAATELAGSIDRMMWLAVLLNCAITFAGLGISYGPDLPTGATMVIVAGAVYVAVIVFGRIRPRLRQVNVAPTGVRDHDAGRERGQHS
jgi:zinc transport system permease protein